MKNLTIVIFGGTGDLAKKKLIPAIRALAGKENIGAINLVSTGRRPFSAEQYLSLMSFRETENLRVHYLQADFDKKRSLDGLYPLLEKIEDAQTAGRLFYLSTSPKYFNRITEKISQCCTGEKSGNQKFNRILIEKPFGQDLKTSRALNRLLSKHFSEEQIFRIDHYLGKETIQNILILRLSNPFFEKTWNSEFIESVKIIISENEGVGDRLDYYNGAGAIRDMIQNHMLQMLSFILMDTPKSPAAVDVHEKKTDAIKKLQCTNIFTGQYEGYNEELLRRGQQKSATETFVSAELQSTMKKWKGTKIILQTGKHLISRFALIEINYKKEPCNIYCDINTFPNRLVMHIQPKQDLSFYMNIRTPGKGMEISHIHMNFSKEQQFSANSPEGYLVILEECILGEKTLFITQEELDAAWKVTDEMRKNIPAPIIYRQGSKIEEVESEAKKEQMKTQDKK